MARSKAFFFGLVPALLVGCQACSKFSSQSIDANRIGIGLPAPGPDSDTAINSPPAKGRLIATDPHIWFNTASRIYSMDVDGSNKTYLTDSSAHQSPEWSCDGSQIIYVSNNQVWIMNADGSGKVQLTAVEGQGAFGPSISCDGKLVYGAFDSSGRATVWIKDSLGSVPRQLSSEGTFDAAARISPDGTKVAFTRYLNWSPQTHKDDGREIFVIGTDGTGERQLTFLTDDPNAPNANAPAWSPDSRKIAFFNGFEEEDSGQNRTQPDTRNLAVINADGSGRLVLTHCDVTEVGQSSKVPGACADDPNWSPDGKWIIYSYTGDQKTYITAADGSSSPQLFFPSLLLFGSGGGRPWKY